MKIKELAKLKEMIGEKISILKSSDLVPACYYGTLQGFKIDKWAQYENCLYIYIKLFRKRSVNKIIITPNEDSFIFKGDFGTLRHRIFRWRVWHNLTKSEQLNTILMQALSNK